jgi:hypothetical protein
MFAPMAMVQAAQVSLEADAPWKHDLATFDAELAQRKAAFASEHLSGKHREDVKRVLSQLRDLDQFARGYWNAPQAHGYAGTASEPAFLAAFEPRMDAVDAENLHALKALLDRWGWFDRKTWGDEADADAWILTHHADRDLSFQKRVLDLLEPLVPSGGTDPSNFAYLCDRVAVNDHRLQRFGTQGYCTGPGTWKPRPIEDPEHVDERRKAVGLPPLKDYIASFQNICHEDQTQRALRTLGLPVHKP